MAEPPAKDTVAATVDDADAGGGAAEPAHAGARYDVGAEIARGGMGRVREARDRVLDRPVALKELVAGTPQQRARFQREARITARLQHPSIVPVYDAGTLDDGEPFYCMKLVSGRSLDDLIAEAGGLDGRLALLPHVLAAVEALAYAHMQGVIHRDLKPLNILVGAFGETLVIDWGIAKDLREGWRREDEPPWTFGGDKITQLGAVLGTPAYMPPEQAAGKPVDERADVYALGAILYHVIVGEPPWTGADSKQLLRRVASGPPAFPRRPHVAEDLWAIVVKAMAFDARDRYPTANELAADLRRFQTGQLVGAYRYSPMTRVRRWLRRHRGAAAMAGALVVALAATVALSFRRVVAERDRAEAANRALEQSENELVLLQAEGALARDPTATLAWLKRHRAQSWLARALAEEAVARGAARHAFSLGAASRTLAASPATDLVAVAEDDGAVEIFDAAGGSRRLVARLGGGAVAIAFSPDGRTLASGGPDGAIRLWGADGGRADLLCCHASPVRWLAYAGTARLASGDDAGLVMVWDTLRHAGRRVAFRPGGITALAVSEDGARLALGRRDGAIVVADLAAGSTLELAGHTQTVLRLAFLPDGRLASTSEDDTVRLWDGRAGRVLGTHDDWIPGLSVSPDGATVATSSGDGSVKLWRSTGEVRVVVLRGHDQTVYDVAWSRDGARLASASRDGTVRVWDAASGESSRLVGHGDAVMRLRFTAGGRLATLAGEDLRVWDAPGAGPTLLRGHEGAVRVVAWSPRGDALASGGSDRTVRMWDPAGGSSRVLGRHDGWVTTLRFPGEDLLFSGGLDGSVRLWDPATGAETVVPVDGPALVPTVSAGGRRLAYVDNGNRIHVRELAGRSETVLAGHTAGVQVLRFSRDGGRLLSASRDGSVRVWDVDSASGRVLGDGLGYVNDAAWSPSETRVAAGGTVVRMWDAATGGQRTVTADGRMTAFSPDERWVSFAADDNAVVVWEPEAGRLRRFRGHRTHLREAVVSPDGRMLASYGFGGELRLWSVDRGASAVLAGHRGDILDVAFDPAGRRLASAGEDGVIRIWDLARVRFGAGDGDDLRAWLAGVTSVEVGSRASPRTP